MKILMVLDQPNMYGSELHFLDLADHFNQLYFVKVVVFTEGPLLSLLSERNINYTIIQTGWFPPLVFFIRLFKVINAFSPDLIHSHQPKANFLITILNIFLRKKNIVTIHSQALDHSLVHKNIVQRKLVYIFHRFVQFISEFGALKVIYVSYAASKTSFFKNKVVVLYNWLGKKFALEIKRKQDSRKPIRLIAVGAVTYAKGYDLLVKFQKLIGSQPVEIQVVGSDESMFAMSLKKQIMENGIKNIRFEGYQINISEYLQRADFFVLFSRSETFGLSYIEAMYYGLPVLSLNYDTMKEIIPKGNSISNNLNDHARFLLQLHNDPLRYTQVSDDNSFYVKQNFSYANAMHQYEMLYSQLTN